MTNKKFIIILVVIVFMIAYFFIGKGLTSKIASSTASFNKVTIESTITPTPSQPKVYKFNKVTDLKKELDSVNPKVEDADFRQLLVP